MQALRFGSDDCDPKSIAKVRCRAAGIEAQAAFNKEYQPPLDAAQDTYAAARHKYRETRANVACEVRDLKDDICCLIDKIECLIKQRHVVECLDEAFKSVTRDLRRCDKRKPPLDCDFDIDCDDSLSAITQRIVEYLAKLEAAKNRFNWLVGEPDRLKARVDAAAAEVQAVKDALRADAAVTDPKKLYVQAIVAWYHLDIVWGDFRTVGRFIDALCAALTCWRDAVVAVSKLVRRQAELKCHQDAKDKECERLRNYTVDEILVVYERLCGHSHHDNDDDDSCGYRRKKHDHDHEDDEDEDHRQDDDSRGSASDDDDSPRDERRRYGRRERYRDDDDDDDGNAPDDDYSRDERRRYGRDERYRDDDRRSRTDRDEELGYRRRRARSAD